MMLNRALPGIAVITLLLLVAGVTVPSIGTKDKRGVLKRTRTLPPGSIPVVVVDEHHEVIRELFDHTVGVSEAVLVHFDSHPDLAFPSLPGAVVSHVVNDNPKWGVELPLFADIADWIMPFVLSKRINYITWVAPQWSEQFYLGEYEMVLCYDNGSVMLYPKHPSDPAEEGFLYWDSVGLLSKQPTHSNSSKRIPFTLFVTRELSQRSLPANVADRHVILDIDEDYFSCGNPLLEHAKTLVNNTEITQLLKRVLSVPDAGAQEELHSFFSDMFAYEPDCMSSQGDKLVDQSLLTRETLTTLQEWCLARSREGWDLSEISMNLDIGLGLPDQVVPTKLLRKNIQRVMGSVQKFIENPRMIMVAKSIGYSPYFQSQALHAGLLATLDGLFPGRLIPTNSLKIEKCILAHLSGQEPAIYMRGIIQVWHLATVEVLWTNGTVSSVSPAVILTSSKECSDIDIMLVDE